MGVWNLGKQDIVRIRRTGATVGTDGRRAAATEVQDTIKGTINPIPGREIHLLPEGERESGQHRLLTTFEVRGSFSDDDAPELADHILFQGHRWEIRDVQIYDSFAPIPHYAARIRRIRS